MPGVIDVTNNNNNVEKMAKDNKNTEKKMKKKTKIVSATCATENPDQVKVAVEIGKTRCTVGQKRKKNTEWI